MSVDRSSLRKEVISLRGRSEYDPESKVLYCCWNEGFFSNCSVTLAGLIEIYNRYRLVPNRIDFSRAFLPYREPEQVTQKTDLYPEFFQMDPEIEIGIRGKIKALAHHDSYRYQSICAFSPFINRFFHLATSIAGIEQDLSAKYRIDYENTLAVCYRGTDKKEEVKLANPYQLIHLTERLLKENPKLRVWIQTEQRQMCEQFLSYFGERCFVVHELPVQAGNVPMENILPFDGVKPNRFEFGQILLAVTHMLSQCGWVVNHTGNKACWIWLFRGNADRMWQFDRRGELVSWDTPIKEFWDHSRSFLYYRIAKNIKKSD